MHCKSRRQAEYVLAAIAARMGEVGLRRSSRLALNDLATWLTPVVVGWMRCYGRLYRSALSALRRRVNFYLKRWLGRSTSGCGPTKPSKRGGPGSSNEDPARSPTGSGSARTSRVLRRAR